MSFNKLKYDNCAYKHNLNESVGTLAYILDPSRYENCNKCRMELGILGGTNVSHIKGNLVDLETDLRGTTRHATKCPSKKYLNPCPNGNMNECNPGNIIIEQNAGNSGQVLDTNMRHLQPCQMIKYRNTPLEPEIPKVLCPQTERVNNNNKQEPFRNTNVNAFNSFENYSPF
jgi:hypothetical protein